MNTPLWMNSPVCRRALLAWPHDVLDQHRQPRPRAARSGRRFHTGQSRQAPHVAADGKGDWIVFYSPKTDYPDGAPLQAFTAIGQVTDDEVYQEDLDPEFQPWRRRMQFLPCAETPIRPLLDDLEFVEDKSRWGYRFRAGVFQIGEHDFEVIRSAMTG